MSAPKFLFGVDFTEQQAYNMLLERLSAHPDEPETGRIYFNTTHNVVYYFNGSIWVAISKPVAGDGLSESVTNGIQTLKVEVDNTGIEINGNTLRLKDLGVTSAKLASNAVTTVKITNANVTFAKIQNIPTMTVIGRVAAGTGVPSAITILNDNDFASADAFTLATSGSIKAFIDSRIASLGRLIDGFDANANSVFPSSGATKKGDFWYVTVAGTVQGETFEVGDTIVAKQDAAENNNNNHFIFLQTNRDQATTDKLGMVMLATDAEVQAGESTTKAVTPAGLDARTATEDRTGLIKIATQEITDLGEDDTQAVTPLKQKAYFDKRVGGWVGNIGNNVANTFVIDHPADTKDVRFDIFDNATGETVYPRVERTSVSQVTVKFGPGNTPTTNQFRYLITKVAA